MLNKIPAWRVIGASVMGTSHRERSQPCQDNHAYGFTPQGDLLVAVADGAGSANRSQDGSRIAVQQAIATLHDHLACTEVGETPAHPGFLEQAMLAAFGAARAALVDYAEQEQIALRALATTLTCVVATDTLLVAGMIGDGLVVVEHNDGTLHTIVQPQRGEYANETTFLVVADMLRLVDVQVHAEPIRSLVVSTDGLLRLAMQLPAYDPSPRFFRPLVTFLHEATDMSQAHQELEAFLASERVCNRTDDDKTLVLAMRGGAA